MSTLHAFLHPASAEDILEVEVSKRFRDENGKAVPFKIRAVTQEENDLLVKRSMRPVKGGRRGEKELDGSLLAGLWLPPRWSRTSPARSCAGPTAFWTLWRSLERCCWPGNSRS